MILHDLTQGEIEFLLNRCNFTDLERKLFLLRTKNVSLVECSFRLHMSVDGIKKISQKVNRKIIKVI